MRKDPRYPGFTESFNQEKNGREFRVDVTTYGAKLPHNRHEDGGWKLELCQYDTTIEKYEPVLPVMRKAYRDEWELSADQTAVDAVALVRDGTRPCGFGSTHTHGVFLEVLEGFLARMKRRLDVGDMEYMSVNVKVRDKTVEADGTTPFKWTECRFVIRPKYKE